MAPASERRLAVRSSEAGVDSREVGESVAASSAVEPSDDKSAMEPTAEASAAELRFDRERDDARAVRTRSEKVSAGQKLPTISEVRCDAMRP